MFVSVHGPSMIEGAGSSAETTPANDFESVRSSSAQFTASFRPPPPLLHPLDISHHITFLGRLVCACPGSRRRHTGDFNTVSERRRDGCCSCAVVIRPVPVLRIWGWFARSFIRLFELLQTLWSAAILLLSFSFSEEGEELRLQDQAGFDRWIYLIGLKETGHF